MQWETGRLTFCFSFAGILSYCLLNFTRWSVLTFGNTRPPDSRSALFPSSFVMVMGPTRSLANLSPFLCLLLQFSLRTSSPGASSSWLPFSFFLFLMPSWTFLTFPDTSLYISSCLLRPSESTSCAIMFSMLSLILGVKGRICYRIGVLGTVGYWGYNGAAGH